LRALAALLLACGAPANRRGRSSDDVTGDD
jgi:hypothetical protein